VITEDAIPDYIKGNISKDNFTIETGTTLDEIEKKAILATLDFTGWNKSRAAKVLNIGRKTLLRKLEEYGMGTHDDNEDEETNENSN
jgi:DNA-binding NtrC family response regulator